MGRQQVQGFSEQELEQLKDKCGHVILAEDIQYEGQECAICLAPFEADMQAIQFKKCRHVFHTDCLESWLKINPICPMCKADKREELVDDEMPGMEQETTSDPDHSDSEEKPEEDIDANITEDSQRSLELQKILSPGARQKKLEANETNKSLVDSDGTQSENSQDDFNNLNESFAPNKDEIRR